MKFLRSLLSGVAVLALAFALASCGEAPVAPAAPDVVQPNAQTSPELLELLSRPVGQLGLVRCEALPADRESEWIGPQGGTLRVGPHRLVIPAGALKRWTLIRAEAPSEHGVRRVVFEPHGLEFEKPVALTMSFDRCNLLGTLLPGHIVYTTEDLRILEVLNAVPNLLREETTAKIDHFSDYVLAW